MVVINPIVKIKMEFSWLADLIDTWIEIQQDAILSKRKSNDKSIATNCYQLFHFLKHLKPDFQNIRKSYFETKRSTKHLKSSSQIRLYHVINSFLKVLKEEGLITKEDIESIKDLKPHQIDKKKQTYPLKEDVVNLIKAIKEQKSNHSYDRELTIFTILFLANTGLRITEALDLVLDDISLDSKRLIVKNGKGGKLRRVGLSEASIKTIQDYLKIRPENASSNLILQRNGSRYKDYRVIYRRIKRVCGKIGLDLSCHSFRRFNGRQLILDNNLSSEMAAKSLGHSSVDVFRDCYGIIDESEVLEAVSNSKGFLYEGKE